MPFREKMAWLTLVSFVVTYGPYFVLAKLDPPAAGELPNVGQLVRFGLTVTAQVVILAAGSALFAIRSGEEAYEPADERDLAIERRSRRVAYYVLICGAIVSGAVLPFYEEGWAIVNATLAAIVVAETVHYGIVVRSYRRGWHE